MFILKFGGSSVADSAQMLNVINILKSNLHSYDTNKIVVLSACKGITDKLQAVAQLAADKNSNNTTQFDTNYHIDVCKIETHHFNIINQTLTTYHQEATQNVSHLLEALSSLLRGVSFLKELTKATADAVLAFGELLSTTIFHYICLENGLQSTFLDARDLIFTDNNYGAANPLLEECEQNIQCIVHKVFDTKSKLIVTQGFIASHSNESVKKTTTLGRGGSDYTAAFIGAALNAEEIQIWTDVDGILSADPRVCASAKTIDQMEFNEVQDLAFWGAKVIHPKTILPAIKKNINIKVLNSFNPNGGGTTIKSNFSHNDFAVKSIIAKENCTLIQSAANHLQTIKLNENPILYRGKSNGLHVTLFDNQALSSYTASSYNDFAVPINIFQCSAICITGNNIKKHTSQLGTILAKILNCLGAAKLHQIIYEFFDNSIIFIVSNVVNMDAVIRQLHDNVIVK